MKAWDSHFSSLGSKRAPITMDGKEKQIFETKMKTYGSKEYSMSSWNERVKDLHKDAQLIEDADTLKKASDQRMYQMMMQDTQQYADMAEEMSLRDLNKFQFRNNRSDGPVPVQRAGSE
jgi:hypothetical protein